MTPVFGECKKWSVMNKPRATFELLAVDATDADGADEHADSMCVDDEETDDEVVDSDAGACKQSK
jgi:hypothetical protein